MNQNIQKAWDARKEMLVEYSRLYKQAAEFHKEADKKLAAAKVKSDGSGLTEQSNELYAEAKRLSKANKKVFDAVSAQLDKHAKVTAREHKVYAQGRKVRAEISRLQADSSRLLNHATQIGYERDWEFRASDIARASGDKLMAEAEAMYADADMDLFEAIMKTYGDITYHIENETLVLVNGERFE